MQKNILRNAWNAVLDLIYPADLYCICCRKIIDSTRPYRLCNECMDGVKWADSRLCIKCGKLLSPSNPGNICFNCREHPHQFDHGYTCAEYGTHERAMIFALKYSSRADIGVTIGEIMADRMLAENSISDLHEMYDAVIPVPVHSSKMAVRGYNQAEIIAKRFADLTGLSCDAGILIRARETHVMRSLGPDQRRENIRGAFEIRKRRVRDIEGKKFLLIDDIYTTGATADEISAVLKRAKARRVDVLSFASGADMVK